MKLFFWSALKKRPCLGTEHFNGTCISRYFILKECKISFDKIFTNVLMIKILCMSKKILLFLPEIWKQYYLGCLIFKRDMKMNRIKLEKQQQKQTHNFIAAYWVFFFFSLEWNACLTWTIFCKWKLSSWNWETTRRKQKTEDSLLNDSHR